MPKCLAGAAPRDQADLSDFWRSAVVLTELGKDVLDGRTDQVAVNGIDRWRGGVHLNGSARYRRNESAHDLDCRTSSKPTQFIGQARPEVDRVFAEAEAGRYELDYAQQPPFGFFSATYLGEVAACIPLLDSGGRLDALKRRVAAYPEALRRAIVQDYLSQAEFALAIFARNDKTALAEVVEFSVCA
jgi:hypothetical protein